MNDADLIKLFASTRDEAAFAILVDRHGPMVLGICRRILRNTDDAEDAFQATFLLLAIRASKIRQQHLLGNWLFGVATRTALNVRRLNQRRAVQEKRLMRILRRESRDVAADADLHLTLDEEINRLPDKYRKVIVSCYLQGMTKREAAKYLEWPEGTVATRLRQSLQLLRKRLAGKGGLASPEALATALAPAAVPTVLSGSTVKVAALAAAGKLAGATAISTKAVRIATGTSKAILTAKIKLAAILLLASSAAVTAPALVAQLRPGVAVTTPAKSMLVSPRSLASSSSITQPAQRRPTTRPADSVSGRRLRMIVQAIFGYANVHHHLPPNLGATLEFNGTSVNAPGNVARLYLSPEDEARIPLPTTPTAQWVNEHTSFVYLGNADVAVRQLRGQTAIAHEKLDSRHGDPIAIVFLDGGSAMVAPVQARWMIAGAKRAIDAARASRR